MTAGQRSAGGLEPCVVLFSGGRDSSLAACLEANSGRAVTLLTAASGATIPTDVVVSRVDEIRRAFPQRVIDWTTRPCNGIFRRIALANIEDDFRNYKTNLILLGHQLAIQSEGLCFCLERGIGRMVTGFSGYQSPAYMEQTPEAIDLFAGFCRSFGVSLVTPIAGYAALDDVKFRLLDFGVTTKSLEAVSLFADTFSPASREDIVAYLGEKLPTASEYVSFRSGRSPKR